MADNRPVTPREAYGPDFDHSHYDRDHRTGHHEDSKNNEIGTSGHDRDGREHFTDRNGHEVTEKSAK